jgi:hypothetical protein
MKIIFDRAKHGSFGNPADPRNTPLILCQRREKFLRCLGEFIGAEKVEYFDCDKNEEYKITKGNKQLVLYLMSTPIDGAWMNIEVKDALSENSSL